ncbi:hypothetical protein, partial [Rhodanobacter lindaniclasticus]
VEVEIKPESTRSPPRRELAGVPLQAKRHRQFFQRSWHFLRAFAGNDQGSGVRRPPRCWHGISAPPRFEVHLSRRSRNPVRQMEICEDGDLFGICIDGESNHQCACGSS